MRWWGGKKKKIPWPSVETRTCTHKSPVSHWNNEEQRLDPADTADRTGMKLVRVKLGKQNTKTLKAPEEAETRSHREHYEHQFALLTRQWDTGGAVTQVTHQDRAANGNLTGRERETRLVKINRKPENKHNQKFKTEWKIRNHKKVETDLF